MAISDLTSVIVAAYRDILGRTPSGSEIAIWQAYADAGAGAGAIRPQIAASIEAAGIIAYVYRTTLGRDPDAGGLRNAQQVMGGGLSQAGLRAAFAQSDEERSDVADIYREVLGRDPDEPGAASWRSAIGTTLSLADARNGIAHSVEGQARLRQLYQDQLGRTADAGGLDAFTNFLGAGHSIADARASIAYSAEEAALIKSIYKTLVGRDVDAAGLSGLEARLAAGATLSDVRLTIASTPVPVPVPTPVPTPVPAPIVAASLLNDTGISATDRITQDAAITGRETGGTLLSASLDAGPAAAVTLAADGSFTLSTPQVAVLSGGTVTPGAHVLHLIGSGPGGTTANDVAFTFAIPAPVAFDLAAADQAGTAGQHLTRSPTVTLAGTTTPGATVQLLAFGTAPAATTVADAAGTFTFAAVPLALGDSTVTITASDASGPGTALALTLTRNSIVADAGAALVRTWNSQTLSSIQTIAMDPEMASRALAIESVAVADTIASIGHQAGTLVSLTAPNGISTSAALASAARDVLAYLFPTQVPTFDALLAKTLSGLGLTLSDSSVSFGRQVAAAVVAIRDRDGWNIHTPYAGSTVDGQWRPTGPDFSTAQQPQFATLTPWLLSTDSQFRAAAPPALGTPAYEAALAQVKSLGSATSTTRTADQTQIARFWNDGSGSFTPPGHWDAIALQVSEARGQNAADTANTLAELNVTQADAAVATWDTKFIYSEWRPISAIQQGDATVAADPTWNPLIKTPPHPSYVSGHSDFSASSAAVLDSVFGTTAFSTTSVTAPGVTRSFTSFDAAAAEAAISRVYGGIHFGFDSTAGLAQGASVGTWDLSHFAGGVGPQLLVDAGVPSYMGGTLAVGGYALDSRAPLVALSAGLDGGAARGVAVDRAGRFAVNTAGLFGALTPGRHVLSLLATDVAGQVATQSVLFTVPGAGAAAITLTDPGALGARSVLSGTVAAAAGTTLRAVALSVDGGGAIPIAVDDTGVFTMALPLGGLMTGAHTFQVTALDSQGGIGTASVTDPLDTLVPLTVIAETPAGFSSDIGVTYRPTITFSRAVDPTTLNSSSLFLTDASGARVAATVVAADGNTGAVLLPVGAMPGASRLTLHVEGALIRGAADGALLDASGAGYGAGSEGLTSFTTVSTAAVTGTSITGIVADPGADFQPGSSDDVHYNADGTRTYLNPLAGVTVYILGHEDTAVLTDANGRFTLTNTPAGDVKIVLNGRTATNAPAGFFFPEMTLDTQVTPGRVNTVMGGMGTAEEMAANRVQPGLYLPRVPTDVLQAVSATTTTVVTPPADSGITLSAAQRNLISLTLAPGSIVGADGTVMATPLVGVAPVPSDIVRDMLPPGILEHSFDITIQAPGAALFTQPATLTLPNVFNLDPGEKTYILSFDHTTGKLVIDGTATASADGLTVTTDPGQGITKPGWHGMTPPVTKVHVDPAKPKKPDDPKKPDPEDKTSPEKGPTAAADTIMLTGGAAKNKGKPITIPVLANDTAGDEPINPASLAITGKPTHGTAVVAGGAIVYTSTDGTSSDSFGYVVSDSEPDGPISTSAAVTIKGDCPEPTPLKVDGGSVEHGDAVCKVTGNSTLTNVDGASILLNISGEQDVWADHVDVKNADITVGFGVLAGKRLVQSGVRGGGGTFMVAGAIATDIKSSAKGTDPLLAGLIGVEVTSITLRPDEIDVGGSLELGPQFGNILLPLSLDSSTPAYQAKKAKAGLGVGASGLAILASGAELASASVKLPDKEITTGSELGGLKIKLSGVAFSYDRSVDTAKIQGKLTIARFWKENEITTTPTSAGLGVTIDLSDKNYFQIKDGKYAVVGDFEITNIILAPNFEIPSVKIHIDTITGHYVASGAIAWGLGYANIRLDASLSIQMHADGTLHFDGASVGLTAEIPISPVLIFQQASFAVAGIDPTSTDDFSLAGTLRLSVGKQLSGDRFSALKKIGIDIAPPYALGELSLSGKFAVLKSATAQGQPGDIVLSSDDKTFLFLGSTSLAKVTLSGAINVTHFQVIGATVKVSLLNGALNGIGMIDIGRDFSGGTVTGTVSGALPTNIVTKVLGANATASESFTVSFTDPNNPANDYLLLQGGITGGLGFTLRVNFDGSGFRFLPTFGSAAPKDLAAAADTVAGAGAPDLTLSIVWLNDTTVIVPVLLLYRATSGGPVTATYTEAQFASIGASFIDGFGTGTRVVKLTAAAAGSWTLAIDTAALTARLGADPATFDLNAALGDVNTTGVSSRPDPLVLSFGTLTSEDRTAYSGTFGYSTTGSSVVFYETTDPLSRSGGLFLGRGSGGANQTFTASSVAVGAGYVYGIVSDDFGRTAFSGASPFQLAGPEVSNLTTTLSGPSVALVAGSPFQLVVTVTNSGADIARAVSLPLLFRGAELLDNHQADGKVATALGTTVNLGDIKPGGSATLTLDLRSLPGTGAVSVTGQARAAGASANTTLGYTEYANTATQPAPDPSKSGAEAIRLGEKFTADLSRLASASQTANTALVLATLQPATTFPAGSAPAAETSLQAAFGLFTSDSHVAVTSKFDLLADIRLYEKSLPEYFAARGAVVAGAAAAALQVPIDAADAILADLTADDALAQNDALATYTMQADTIVAALQVQLAAWYAIAADSQTLYTYIVQGTDRPTLDAAITDLAAQLGGLNNQNTPAALGAQLITAAATAHQAQVATVYTSTADINQALALIQAQLAAGGGDTASLKIEEAKLLADIAGVAGDAKALLYAAFRGPDGLVQRTTFTAQDGVTISLTPNTFYEMTVFSPAALTIGRTFFKSNASGVDTTLPSVGLLPDDGMAGADGLTPTAAYVVGVTNTAVSALVPGLTDLAALRAGLVPASALTGVQGVVGSLTLSGSAQAVVLAAAPGAARGVEAIVATGTGVAVVDVTKPTSPIRVAEVALAGGGTAVAYDAATATALVATPGGTAIIDVSTPGALVVRKLVAGVPTAVATIAGTGYIAAIGTVTSIDLASGVVLQRLRLGTASIASVVASGSTLYALDAGGQFSTVAVVGGFMTVTGTVAAGVTGRLFVGGTTAYVAVGAGTTGGYATIDITRNDAPALIAGPADRGIAGAAVALNGAGLGVTVGPIAIARGSVVNALDVIGTADPTLTNQLVTRITLPGTPQAVAIGAGLAFVADGASGLQVVNFAQANTATGAPTVKLTTRPVDVDTVTTGVQVYAGQPVTLGVAITGPTPIATTELLLNGRSILTDVSFPFDLTTALPGLLAGTTAVLQVRATDTAGNVGLSEALTVQLVADTSPLRLLSQTVGAGSVVATDGSGPFSFTFSRPLDAAAVSATSLRVLDSTGVETKAATFALTDGGRTVTATFGPLAAGTYSLLVDDTALRDLGGVAYGAAVEILPFQAAVFTTSFINPDGGSWNDPKNWSAGKVPNAADAVLVQLGRGTVVTLDSSSVAPASLLVGGAQLVANGLTLSKTLIQTVFHGQVVFADRGSALNSISTGGGAALTVVDNAAITATGTLTNNGVITLASVGSYTALNVSGPVTLAGTGLVTMQAGGSVIQGAGTLTSSSIIQGAGLIGDDGGFSFVNSGLVNATSSTQQLILGTGAASVINTGTLQSTAAGGLLIRSVAVANTGGTIQALDGGKVLLQTATITGGRLHTAGTGTIVETDRGSVLDGVSMAGGDAITINDNAALSIRNTINNGGTITTASIGSYTALLVQGAVTLQGGGQIILSSGGGSVIQSSGGASVLTNVDNTITGGGVIGDDGNFALINRATIDASSATRALVLGSGPALVNSGTIQATGAAGLLIRTQTVQNTGVIQALDGSTVVLQNATLKGGRLRTAGTGTIVTADRYSVLDGVTIDAGSQVTIGDNQALTLVNTKNQGTFTLASIGSYTALLVSGDVGLSGSTVTMRAGGSVIQGAGTLTSSSTIQGAGSIGDDGGFRFVNTGLVDANLATQAMIIGTGAAPVVNMGTLQASAAGGLLIRGQTVNNAGGTIRALDGATVTLQTATLLGGTLATVGTGAIVTGDRNSTLRDLVITAGSTVRVQDNQALSTAGAITVQGTLSLASAGSYTGLILAGTTTIAGALTLSDSGANQINGSGTATTLAISGVLRGAGQVGTGDANVTLSNSGTIDANGGNALRIDTGATQVGNAGTMQASGAGGLVVSSAMLNSGLVWARSGPVFLGGAITGTGRGELSGASQFEYGSPVSAGQTVTFDTGATGTLRLDQGVNFAGTIVGFRTGNAIDLADFAFSGSVATSYTASGAGGTLRVTDGTHTANLALTGGYSAASFTASNDGVGHVLLRATA